VPSYTKLPSQQQSPGLSSSHCALETYLREVSETGGLKAQGSNPNTFQNISQPQRIFIFIFYKIFTTTENFTILMLSVNLKRIER
jgi:hypothetical protein